MTSRTSRHRGFTLIELLIVVSIIIALVGILVPALAHAKKAGMKAAAQQQLEALQAGLAQYYAVFNVYPSSTTPAYGGHISAGRGAAALAEGLIGYLDFSDDGAGPSNPSGADGNGFRMHKVSTAMGGGGTIYGPYAATDGKGYFVRSPTDQYFIDPWGSEILYYRSTQSLATPPFAPAAVFSTTTTPHGLFISDDCKVSANPNNLYGPNPDPGATGTSLFFQAIGATSNSAPSMAVKGADSFLLISAGPDGVYFSDDDVVAGKQ